MEQLKKVLEQLHIFENDEKARRDACDKFAQYMEGILSWNEKVNLTSITDRQEFVKKHFMDSILCAGGAEIQAARQIIDVGTGGGFPGIPLAILYPDKDFVLVDSLQKRVQIISQLCSQIGIQNVSAIHGRAEDLASPKGNYREQFDVCISRAVANMSTLVEYCLPFVKVGGFFIAYKGPEYASELFSAHYAIQVLGGEYSRTEQRHLEEFDLDHKLIYIKKSRKTPSKYPRKAGTPSKTPLK